MILSSRRQRRKGLLWRFSKQYVEVTAALDSSPPPRVTHDPRPERGRNEPNTMDAFQNSMLAPMARELKDLRARVETLTAKGPADIRPVPTIPQEYRMPDRKVPVVEAAPLQAFRKAEREKPAVGLPARALPSSEVEELKKVLLRSLEKPAVFEKDIPAVQPEKVQVAVKNNAVAALAEGLRASGLEEEVISQLMIPVSDAASRGETPDQLRARLNKSVAGSISCSGPFKLKKNAARILAMVGPTGVGKTTTIAKLAALAYKQGVTVALITIDTFRIGAIAQLQTYSGIMDMPMEIAATPAELAEAIAVHADKQLIFIDTAGRNPQDRKRIQEMKAFLDVQPGHRDPPLPVRHHPGQGAGPGRHPLRRAPDQQTALYQAGREHEFRLHRQYASAQQTAAFIFHHRPESAGRYRDRHIPKSGGPGCKGDETMNVSSRTGDQADTLRLLAISRNGQLAWHTASASEGEGDQRRG